MGLGPPRTQLQPIPAHPGHEGLEPNPWRMPQPRAAERGLSQALALHHGHLSPVSPSRLPSAVGFFCSPLKVFGTKGGTRGANTPNYPSPGHYLLTGRHVGERADAAGVRHHHRRGEAGGVGILGRLLLVCIHCGEKGDKRLSRKSHPEPWKRSKAGKPHTAQRGAWGWMLCGQGHDKTSGRKEGDGAGRIHPTPAGTQGSEQHTITGRGTQEEAETHFPSI